eukprot:COSAG03_NODE_2638_length_2573_cov_152.610752_1_plen_312_part_00
MRAGRPAKDKTTERRRLPGIRDDLAVEGLNDLDAVELVFYGGRAELTVDLSNGQPAGACRSANETDVAGDATFDLCDAANAYEPTTEELRNEWEMEDYCEDLGDGDTCELYGYHFGRVPVIFDAAEGEEIFVGVNDISADDTRLRICPANATNCDDEELEDQDDDNCGFYDESTCDESIECGEDSPVCGGFSEEVLFTAETAGRYMALAGTRGGEIYPDDDLGHGYGRGLGPDGTNYTSGFIRVVVVRKCGDVNATWCPNDAPWCTDGECTDVDPRPVPEEESDKTSSAPATAAASVVVMMVSALATVVFN